MTDVFIVLLDDWIRGTRIVGTYSTRPLAEAARLQLKTAKLGTHVFVRLSGPHQVDHADKTGC